MSMGRGSPKLSGAAPLGRRLGHRVSAVAERRGEILAMAYGLATLGAIGAWAAAPGQILNVVGIAFPVATAGLASALFFLFRRRLPPYAEDVAVLGSLALLGVGIAYTAQPALFTPYYVWVGFSAPMWFGRRRAVLYLLLTMVACGADMLVAGTRAALASWFVTSAILVVAFLVVEFLSRRLVDHERLAAVGEMASAVGHELRNPLTAISNALYLIRASLPEPLDPETERHLRLAERETTRASSITEDVMAFVRPRVAVLARIEVREVVAAALATAPPPEAVRVEKDLSEARLYADRDQVVEVMTNLLSNAYEAMPSGVVTVRARPERGRVVLSVADTGPGMEKAVSDRVFEPFFTTRHRGTGLGLAIVRRLVEDHGGTVEVHSTPGQGTTFVLRLPAAPAAPAVPRGASSGPSGTPAPDPEPDGAITPELAPRSLDNT
ncbi:MAG TPA: hypothetical protein DCQ30_00570 [Acidimicrobiaceae bacterium]|nr:hypothetical protein [Acidimicrobiaceae bacterium]